MSDIPVHPFDAVLAQWPGIERVTEKHVRESAHGTALPAVVLLAAGAHPITSMVADLDLTFVPNGVKMAVPPRERGTRGIAIPWTATAVNADGSFPLFTIGVGYCGCPPHAGGPLWNPLCVALVWTPAVSFDVRNQLPRVWLDMVRTAPQQFCHGGIKTMQALGIL